MIALLVYVLGSLNMALFMADDDDLRLWEKIAFTIFWPVLTPLAAGYFIIERFRSRR